MKDHFLPNAAPPVAPIVICGPSAALIVTDYPR